MSPRNPDTTASSARSTGSVSPGCPALPPIPPVSFFTTVQVEQPMACFSDQHLDSITPPPEDQSDIKNGFTETVSEEHPYACIDNVRDNEPSSPSPCDEADEGRQESESPYHTITEWREPTASSDVTSFLPVTNSEKAEDSESPAVQDDQPLLSTDGAAIYAAVNRKTKSQRGIQEAPVKQDTPLLGDDEAPPVPQKTFD